MTVAPPPPPLSPYPPGTCVTCPWSNSCFLSFLGRRRGEKRGKARPISSLPAAEWCGEDTKNMSRVLLICFLVSAAAFGGARAWGGLFNRFNPSMLSNLGYGSSGGYGRQLYGVSENALNVRSQSERGRRTPEIMHLQGLTWKW